MEVDAAQMDMLTLLKQDHDRVKDLFQQIDQEQGQRQRLFHEVARELKVHAAVEEELLYPAVKEALRDRVAESVEEHHQYEMVIDDLSRIPTSNLDWRGKFNALKEDVNHHIEDEEEKLFPKTRQILDQPTLESLGARMEQRKVQASRV